MKIAQVCHAYFPSIGGMRTHVQEISERFAAYENVVEVLTTDPSGQLARMEVINKVTVKRFKGWAPGDAYFFSGDLRKFIRNHIDDYDIVHSHNFASLPALYTASAKREKSHLIFTPHYHSGGHTFVRNLLHIPYRIIAKKDFTNAEVIVCVSLTNADTRFTETLS
jgi:1,2-diacylglycerol 3-alpha-glucosyltransferase